jgi:hypothetical protein
MIKGFFLIKERTEYKYLGVDGEHFEPTIIGADLSSGSRNKHIWELHPNGWKKDAIKLFEENMIEELPEDIYLLNNINIAIEIKKMIESHLGKFKIIDCTIYQSKKETIKKSNIIGFDIAYFGGDYYSAILNGLIINPSSLLYEKYNASLNESELFTNYDLLEEYIFDFKNNVKSEENSDFCFYEIMSVS